MQNFYVVKTGWEMFDLSRAYGLGLLLYGLSDKEVFLSDKSYWYELTSSEIQKINPGKLSEFLRDDLSWNELGREIRGKKESIIDFFGDETNINNLISSYSQFDVSDIPTSKGETLYGTMEGRAIKGIRKEIRLKSAYSEGDNINVSKDDWSLSVLGHLNVTVWKYKIPGFDELLAAMPVPSLTGTKVYNLYRSIRVNINNAVKRIHHAGILATLAYIGIEVVKLTQQESPLVYTPQFSSIQYNNLTSTGRGITKRWKPTTGGFFPLEFLNMVGQSLEAQRILNQWTEIFRKTNLRAGYEDLAIYLSEFITYPSLDTLERYLKTHLRFFLTKDIKVSLYEEKTFGEVMQYV
jgi:hypothetical protein